MIIELWVWTRPCLKLLSCSEVKVQLWSEWVVRKCPPTRSIPSNTETALPDILRAKTSLEGRFLGIERLCSHMACLGNNLDFSTRLRSRFCLPGFWGLRLFVCSRKLIWRPPDLTEAPLISKRSYGLIWTLKLTSGIMSRPQTPLNQEARETYLGALGFQCLTALF